MPETPEEFHRRVAGALRASPVENWDTWPFEGSVRPRPLAPPVERETPRQGEGGVDCRRCAAGDGRLDRAISAVGGVGRVHIGRWGEGGAHLHIWFMALPARIEQLRSSFAEIWDDVLPPTPEDIWRANLDAVVSGLQGGA